MSRKTITVTGMSCSGCEETVEDALGALDGVTSVEADNERDTVDVEVDGVSDDELHETIESAGYDVEA